MDETPGGEGTPDANTSMLDELIWMIEDEHGNVASIVSRRHGGAGDERIPLAATSQELAVTIARHYANQTGDTFNVVGANLVHELAAYGAIAINPNLNREGDFSEYSVLRWGALKDAADRAQKARAKLLEIEAVVE